MADDSQLTVESGSPEWASVVDRYNDRYSVLLCTDYLPPSSGGAEHVVETLARRLDKTGVDVIVYTLNSTGQNSSLHGHDSITLIESSAFDLTSILGLQSSVSPRALYDYPKVLREYDPDIVHVHHRFFFTSAVATLFKHNVDCPLVTTLHVGDLDHIDGLGAQLANLFETTVSRTVLSNSDHVICVSDSVAQVADDLGVENVSVIKNAVDTERYRPVAKSEDSLKLLYVGRLVRNNGPQDLIKALPSVLEAVPNLSVEMVGQGHMEADLRELVAETGYSDRITIHGYVDDLMTMWDRADVFCRPSYSEGLPLTLLESMACGVPPIVTPVAGVPEIVSDGENGRLVPCTDPAQLASTIIETVTDAEGRKQMGDNARRTVETNHSWDHRVNRIRELYSSLLINA